MRIKSRVKRIGNSYGCTIKKPLIDAGILEEGEEVIIQKKEVQENETDRHEPNGSEGHILPTH